MRGHDSLRTFAMNLFVTLGSGQCYRLFIFRALDSTSVAFLFAFCFQRNVSSPKETLVLVRATLTPAIRKSQKRDP